MDLEDQAVIVKWYGWRTSRGKGAVSVVWDPPPGKGVAGYRVYQDWIGRSAGYRNVQAGTRETPSGVDSPAGRFIC